MMKLLRLAALVGAASLFVPGTAAAQSGERLTDRDVKSLLETVDNGRDKFEDTLDGKLKNSVLRGPAGEVNVGKFLDDFQQNVDKAKDRFTPDYAASAEVQTVLRQASDIDVYFRGLPGGYKGASEWDRLLIDLRRLAEAYGTTFPLPPNATVRRINDGEAAQSARLVAQQAGAFRKAVDSDKAMAKPARDALKREAQELEKRAKTLESRVKDHKPATSEARAVFEQAGTMQDSFGSQLPPGALQAWGGMRASLTKLQQAFGMLAPLAPLPQ
jgi:hypothetical protein